MNSVPPVPFKRHGTWHAFDAPLERQRLFSPWTVVGFGLALSLGLVLVYPHRTLEQRLSAADSAAGRADTPLTIEYLKVFLKAEPGDSGMRLQLVRKLVAQGDYAGARKLMDAPQTANDPVFMREAGWIRLMLAEQEFFAAGADSPARQALQAQLQEHLRLQARQKRLTPQQLDALGARALADAAPDVALTAYRRLSAAPALLSADSYAQAARGALGLGDYRLGAALLFIAMDRSASRDTQRAYLVEGLRTLQTGGLQDEALTAAESRIGPFGRDIPLLKYLARLAQAANRPDIAERYAKRFLELSLLERWQAFEDRRLAAWTRPRYAPPVYLADMRVEPVSAQAPAGGPALPFDEETYTMGFQIFLANRNLVDARRVAQSAVQQQPQSAPWRRRLAEVNEWAGAPQDALAQWLALAQMTGSVAAWDATLRLSDSLFDQAVLRLALEHKLTAAPGELQWLNRLLALHETAGAPAEAIALLQQRLAQRGLMQGAERVRELEALAGIQERAGRDADALATMLQLQREDGPRTAYALKIANFHYRQGAFRLAHDALEAVRASAAPDDVLYWRNYAELARLLQEDAAARRGYQALLAANAQSDADLANLAALWRAERPRAAAELALYAYQRNGNPALAEEALGIYLQMGDHAAARRLLAQLDSAQRRALEGRAAFLLLRANLAQLSEDLPNARRDLRAALALEPASVEARAALIWVLLALRDTEALKDSLQRWAADANGNEALWDPYAAALMSLNRQDEALRWFRKSGIRKQDYLWLMSYAECLDANSQPEQAWRIRRHVWAELRKPDVLARLQPEQYAAMRDRLAALAPAFTGGEAAWRILQALLHASPPELAQAAPPQPQAAGDGRELLQLLAADQAAAGPVAPAPGAAQDLFAPAGPRNDARLSASAREVALAYALNNDANDLARAWLVSRYASQLARPLWGELSLLLQDGDLDRLNALLDDIPDWLPMYDRVDAAERAGRPALAQTLAFDQLTRLPQDEALHQRVVNLDTAEPAPLQAGVASVRTSPLVATDTVLRGGVALGGGLQMSATLSQRRQHSDDETLLAAVPRTDRVLALAVSRRLDNGILTATLQRREALAGSNGLKLEAEIAPTRDLRVGMAAGVNQVSADSVLLRVGGMQSGLDFNATHALTSREYGRIDLGWRRYRAQGGATLGSGATWRLELGSRLRLAYPDLTLRGFVMGNRFNPDGQDVRLATLLPAGADPDATRLLPEGSTTWGLLLGAGTSAENGYHRGWRPYGEVGLTYNSLTGSGRQLRAGVAGSVLGGDVLRMRWQRVSGNPSAEQGSRELGLDYHLYY